MTYWWLSFADGDRPAGAQFLGACIVQAHGCFEAVRESHRLKINPGGFEDTGFEDTV